MKGYIDQILSREKPKKRSDLRYEIREAILILNKRFGDDEESFLCDYVDEVMTKYENDLITAHKCFTQLVRDTEIKNAKI